MSARDVRRLAARDGSGALVQACGLEEQQGRQVRRLEAA
jgi:hypothetical protein